MHIYFELEVHQHYKLNNACLTYSKLLVEQKANFSTYIGTIGLGFHNVLGPDRNIILDLGIGYQFYNLPEKYKEAITRNGITYNQFGENNSIVGPLSSLSTRFALGFMF